MTKRFLGNVALLVLLNILVKPIYILIIDAEVQNRVGESAYGIYFALFNLTYIFNIVTDLGITNFNNTTLARNNLPLQKNLGKILGIRSLLALIYASLVILVAIILGYDYAVFELLGWLIFNQILVAFVLFLRSNLTALQLFKEDSFISILDRTLLTLSTGAVLWFVALNTPFDILWFVYLQTLAYAITALIAYILVLRRAKAVHWQIDWPFSLAIIKRSWPYALLILLSFLYNRTDAIMLERLLPNGATEAGIYAQGYRFFEAANMFAYLFAVILLPMFSHMLGKGQSVSTLAGTSLRILLAAGVSAVCLVFFLGDDLLNWRYSSGIVFQPEVLTVLMLAFIPVCGGYVHSTLLTAGGRLRWLNTTGIFGLLLNLVLNLYAIPRFGALGAAFTTLVTQTLVWIMQYVGVQKAFKLKVTAKPVLLFVTFSVLGFAGCWLANSFLSVTWLAGAAMLIWLTAIALLTKTLRPVLIETLLLSKFRGSKD